MSDAAAGTKKIAIKTRKVKRDEKKYKPTRFNAATETNKQTIRKKKKKEGPYLAILTKQARSIISRFLRAIFV